MSRSGQLELKYCDGNMYFKSKNNKWYLYAYYNWEYKGLDESARHLYSGRGKKDNTKRGLDKNGL